MMRSFLMGAALSLVAMTAVNADAIIEARDAGTYEIKWQNVALKADIVSTYDNVFETMLTLGEGEDAFSFDAIESYFKPALIRMVELDPTNSKPEVLVMAYTGGAHCCHEVFALSDVDDIGWERVDIGDFDARTVPSAHKITDLDGDGASELFASDDRFLYQFAPYAGSFAPPRILSLRGFDIVERTKEAAFESHLNSALSDLGTAPESGPERNSWLASYAAILLMMGQDDPLDFATSNYDPDVEWGVMQCTDRTKDETSCPKDQLINIGFEAALSDFLIETGHLEKSQ